LYAIILISEMPKQLASRRGFQPTGSDSVLHGREDALATVADAAWNPPSGSGAMGCSTADIPTNRAMKSPAETTTCRPIDADATTSAA